MFQPHLSRRYAYVLTSNTSISVALLEWHHSLLPSTHVTKSYMWTRYILQGDREDLEMTGFTCEWPVNLTYFYVSCHIFSGEGSNILRGEEKMQKLIVFHLTLWCITKSLCILKLVLKWSLNLSYAFSKTYKSSLHASIYLK